MKFTYWMAMAALVVSNVAWAKKNCPTGGSNGSCGYQANSCTCQSGDVTMSGYTNGTGSAWCNTATGTWDYSECGCTCGQAAVLSGGTGDFAAGNLSFGSDEIKALKDVGNKVQVIISPSGARSGSSGAISAPAIDQP